MCTNCKAKTSPCVGGLNCRPGYLCGVRSCQSAVIEKSNFIHVPFECLWRNSLTRTGNPDDLWMLSCKGGCLGVRGLWTSLDGAGRDGRAMGRRKWGRESTGAGGEGAWGTRSIPVSMEGKRLESPRKPEASLTGSVINPQLSHLPFSSLDFYEFQEKLFPRNISF